MHRLEGPSDPDHLRAADGGLPPQAMVIRDVPVVDWRVITPDRNLEMIVVVVAQDGALDFYREPGLLCREARLGEERHLVPQVAAEMHRELPQRETVGCRPVVALEIVEIHEALHMERATSGG